MTLKAQIASQIRSCPVTSKATDPKLRTGAETSCNIQVQIAELMLTEKGCKECCQQGLTAVNPASDDRLTDELLLKSCLTGASTYHAVAMLFSGIFKTFFLLALNIVLTPGTKNAETNPIR